MTTSIKALKNVSDIEIVSTPRSGGHLITPYKARFTTLMLLDK